MSKCEVTIKLRSPAKEENCFSINKCVKFNAFNKILKLCHWFILELATDDHSL